MLKKRLFWYAVGFFKKFFFEIVREFDVYTSWYTRVQKSKLLVDS